MQVMLSGQLNVAVICIVFISPWPPRAAQKDRDRNQDCTVVSDGDSAVARWILDAMSIKVANACSI